MVDCVFNVDDMSRSLSRDGEREFEDGERGFDCGCTRRLGGRLEVCEEAQSLIGDAGGDEFVSVDVARVHCPRYWTRRCWQSATLDNKKCKKNIKIS